MTRESERIIDLYRRHAGAFARQRDKTLLEKAWLDRFLALTPQGAAILDIGCGCGDPIALYLIAQGRRLTGVDSAPES